MALINAGACFKAHTRAYYESKRKAEYIKIDPRTEFRGKSGMIYCKRCKEPKIADFPEYNFVTKCACSCDTGVWERNRERFTNTRKVRESEVRSGDWNPFD